MSNQNKWLWGLRIIALACIIALAVLTVNLIHSPGVRAPLLTMLGGVTIVMTLYPPRTIAIQDLAQDLFTVIGTGIAISGGIYWLFDASQTVAADKRPLILSLTYSLMLILVTYLFVSMLIVIVANWGRIKTGVQRKLRR